MGSHDIKTLWYCLTKIESYCRIQISTNNNFDNTRAQWCIATINILLNNKFVLLLLLLFIFLLLSLLFCCTVHRLAFQFQMNTIENLYVLDIIVSRPRAFFQNYSCLMKEDTVIDIQELASLPSLRMWWAQKSQQKTLIVHDLVVHFHLDLDGCVFLLLLHQLLFIFIGNTLLIWFCYMRNQTK